MERWLRPTFISRLVAAVIVVAVLYFAKPVAMPLAVAILLGIVFSPVVTLLERVGRGRVRVGRIGAVLAVGLAVGGVVAGMGAIVASQGGALADNLPEYQRALRAQLREPLRWLGRLERTAQEVGELGEGPSSGEPSPAKVEVVDRDSELVRFARSWAGSAASLVGTAGLVIVLLVFLLVEREALRDRMLRVLAPRDLHVTTSAFGDAVGRVTRYVRAFALLNLGHGVVVGLGLWLLGVPGALLLGLLSALLRFVPYVGPWLAAGLAVIAALASSEGWTLPLAVGLFLVVLELVSNNVLEPLLFGMSVGLSPFALVLSTIFWAWLWGPIGLVLATPLTACLVAFGRHAPSLEPLAILLSDADALPPAERLYQRLLARDLYEATRLVAERTEVLGALPAWDEVVLPALGLLELDREQERLDAEQLDIARETFEFLLSELPESESSAAAPSVLCIPARGGWDETLCTALARFLSAEGVPAVAVGHQRIGALAEEAARAGPEWVCISSLAGPAGVVQHLVLRIRKRCPETKIVVGLWGQGAETSLRDGSGADAGTYVARRLLDVTGRLRGSTPA